MPLESLPGQRRVANLDPLTPKQLRDAERDAVYIYNVGPKEHRVSLSRLYVIPACKPGEDVSEPLIVPGYVYTSKQKSVVGLHVTYEWHTDDGIDVARDIVGTYPFKSPSENLIPYGVFIAASPIPTAEEIATAKSHRVDKLWERVREADDAYVINNGRVDVGQGRTATNISADAVQAAIELGIERPYASANVTMRKCEDCGTSNMPNAVRCKNAECRAIFDEAKARQRFPEMFQQETKRRARAEEVA